MPCSDILILETIINLGSSLRNYPASMAELLHRRNSAPSASPTPNSFPSGVKRATVTLSLSCPCCPLPPSLYTVVMASVSRVDDVWPSGKKSRGTRLVFRSLLALRRVFKD